MKNPFLKGNAAGYFLLSLIITPLFSALPEWSLTVYLSLLTINICCLLFMWMAHQKITSEKRYNSYTSFLTIFTFALYLSTPLLRMVADTKLFWVAILLIVLTLVYSLVIKQKVLVKVTGKMSANAVTTAYLLSISTPLLVVFSTSNGQRLLELNQTGMAFAFIMYILSLLFIRVSPKVLQNKREMQK